MSNSDRLFIDKFNNFIFTIRKIIFFGDTNSSMQPSNPKHDRLRFINYFGTDTEYYDTSDDELFFDDDTKLKDEFANIYTYKAMSPAEMGDYFQLFSTLSETKAKSGDNLMVGSARISKNFKRRLENKGELLSGASVLTEGKSPILYKKNTDLLKDLSKGEKEEFIRALDFAVKSNPFTSFASTYKKLVLCRDGINTSDCGIKTDHQLFHPILDELHIWEAVSAISERQYVSIKYYKDRPDLNKTDEFQSLLPLKIVYDNLYGRSYLFVYNQRYDAYSTLRFDKIFSIAAENDYCDEPFFSEKLQEVNEILKTAWLVSLNRKTEHTVLEIKNTPALKQRVQNEGRHGGITKITDESFLFEIDVNDSFEMINWILSYGSNCRVVEPEKLKTRIIEYYKEMTK